MACLPPICLPSACRQVSLPSAADYCLPAGDVRFVDLGIFQADTRKTYTCTITTEKRMEVTFTAKVFANSHNVMHPDRNPEEQLND